MLDGLNHVLASLQGKLKGATEPLRLLEVVLIGDFGERWQAAVSLRFVLESIHNLIQANANAPDRYKGSDLADGPLVVERGNELGQNFIEGDSSHGRFLG